MQLEYEKSLNTTFIACWRWIVYHFPCIREDMGARNLIRLLITLIPNQNLRLLIEEYEYTSLDEFFSKSKHTGDEYDIANRIRKRLAFLNEKLGKRLNADNAKASNDAAATRQDYYKRSGKTPSSLLSPTRTTPGPFISRKGANSVTLVDEVTSSPSLIFDTGAEASFFPDCYPQATPKQRLKSYFQMVVVYRR